MIKEKDILQSLMSNTGLFEKIFGKLLDPLVRDTRRERIKNLLKNYWYEDVEKIFPPALDKVRVKEHLEVVMNYVKHEDESWGLFSLSKKTDNE